ncbi:MAG: cytochrome P450 [Nakamurella sp.]
MSDPGGAGSGALSPGDLGFRPGDPAFIADPYPVFRALREAGPVLYYPERDLWLLTRFADVHAALRHRGLGRSYTHRYSAAELGHDEPDDAYPQWQASERWSLLNLEPPDHTRLRRLVTKVFTARSVAAMRPTIERICREQLTTVLTGESFDVLADFAQPYSIAVICALLGVPVEAGPTLLGWSHAIVKMYEFQTTDDERAAAEQAAAEFISYVRALIGDRRADPRDDLITELVQVADDGDRLTEDEIVCTVIVLLNAGHEATVNTLGNGLRAACLFPAEWQRLVRGEVVTAAAVEELIRWDAPLQLFERWVLDDGVELAGRRFRPGERVGMMFGVANRDPLRFPDPDRFDIGRGDAGHIGFGGGTHFCIGAPLARLELDVALTQLSAAGPDLHWVEEPRYQPYFVIRGLRSLRVRLR